ncbi:MAG TPA: hypothetical protein VLU43_01845 [Anaeromyxobacteraceae bacterium]|nr:hypothetical protein [Anaeromyxobacteraceae bacterium]
MTTQRAIGKPAIILAAAIVAFGAGAMGLVYVATDSPGPPATPAPGTAGGPDGLTATPPQAAPPAGMPVMSPPPPPVAIEIPPEESKTGESLPADPQAKEEALEQFRRQRFNQTIEQLNRKPRTRTPRPAPDPEADPDR